MKNTYNKNYEVDSNDNKLVNYEYEESFSVPAIKYQRFEKTEIDENIIAEYPLTFILNNNVYDTYFCLPNNLDDLIIGNLFFKGKIKDKNDILELNIDKDSGIAKAVINENDSSDEKIFINDISYITSNTITNNTVKINLKTAYEFMKVNLNSSKLFHETGGVHCAAIYDIKNNKTIVIREDVARHNALDKAIGYCIKNDIPLNDKILFMSSRISFSMASKVAKAQIPIIISKSAPTNLAIDLCNKLNITLTGFVRGERIKIYANPERIITNEE